MNGLDKANGYIEKLAFDKLLEKAIKHLNGKFINIEKDRYGGGHWNVELKENNDYGTEPYFKVSVNYNSGEYHDGLEAIISRALSNSLGYSLQSTIQSAIVEALREIKSSSS